MAIVLNQRLIQAHYAGGVFVDKSGQGNDGTPANAPNFVANHLGVANSATVFNGVDDYVDLGTNVELNSYDQSLSAWIYLNDRDNPAIQGIVANSDTGSVRDDLNISNNDIKFQCGNGSVLVTCISDAVAPENVWTHVVGTKEYNGSNTIVKLYINGVLQVDVETLSGQSDISVPIKWIGMLSLGIRHFNGSISDVRIYNTTLTEAEITLIYEGGSQSASGILTFNGGRSRTPTFVRAFSGELSFAGRVQVTNPDWLYIPDYLNWMGTWSATVVYDDLDVVLYQDGDLIHVFVSKASHNVGNTPTTAYQWWTRLVQEQWMK